MSSIYFRPYHRQVSRYVSKGQISELESYLTEHPRIVFKVKWAKRLLDKSEKNIGNCNGHGPVRQVEIYQQNQQIFNLLIELLKNHRLDSTAWGLMNLGHLALEYGYPDAIRYLAEMGKEVFDPYQEDPNGVSLITKALSYGHMEVLDFLVNHPRFDHAHKSELIFNVAHLLADCNTHHGKDIMGPGIPVPSKEQLGVLVKTLLQQELTRCQEQDSRLDLNIKKGGRSIPILLMKDEATQIGSDIFSWLLDHRERIILDPNQQTTTGKGTLAMLACRRGRLDLVWRLVEWPGFNPVITSGKGNSLGWFIGDSLDQLGGKSAVQPLLERLRIMGTGPAKTSSKAADKHNNDVFHRNFQSDKYYYYISNHWRWPKNGPEISLSTTTASTTTTTTTASTTTTTTTTNEPENSLTPASLLNTEEGDKRKKFPKHPRCVICRSHIRRREPYLFSPSYCQCAMHPDCAEQWGSVLVKDLLAAEVVDFVDYVIPVCPGCGGADLTGKEDQKKVMMDRSTTVPGKGCHHLISPSFLGSYLELIEGWNKEKEIDSLLMRFNRAIDLVLARANPWACFCPGKKQDGTPCDIYFIQPPDQETYRNCPKCKKSRLIRGRERQAELDREAPIVKEILEQGNIRPCPYCGKLVERNGGCPHMVCSFCRKDFDWHGGKKFNARSKSNATYKMDIDAHF